MDAIITTSRKRAAPAAKKADALPSRVAKRAKGPMTEEEEVRVSARIKAQITVKVYTSDGIVELTNPEVTRCRVSDACDAMEGAITLHQLSADSYENDDCSDESCETSVQVAAANEPMASTCIATKVSDNEDAINNALFGSVPEDAAADAMAFLTVERPATPAAIIEAPRTVPMPSPRPKHRARKPAKINTPTPAATLKGKITKPAHGNAKGNTTKIGHYCTGSTVADNSRREGPARGGACNDGVLAGCAGNHARAASEPDSAAAGAGGGVAAPSLVQQPPCAAQVPAAWACSNCGTSSTPLKRKDRRTGAPLCNACGLWPIAHYGASRPVN